MLAARSRASILRPAGAMNIILFHCLFTGHNIMAGQILISATGVRQFFHITRCSTSLDRPQ
jgi:hypothetical protein